MACGARRLDKGGQQIKEKWRSALAEAQCPRRLPKLILPQNLEPHTCQEAVPTAQAGGLERGRLTWVPVLIRVMGARILTACRSSTSTSTRS